MPYKKTVDGKWKATLGRGSRGSYSSAAAERLLIIDQQVDPKGALQNAALANIMTLSFNSKKHSSADIVQMIITAHFTNKKPFQSIAFANHGPNSNGDWSWAKDMSVSMKQKFQNDKETAILAVRQLAPLLNVMIAALEKTKMGTAHIELLACRLAAVNPSFVPLIEDLYHVDFRASTDDTGNESDKGDWKMETDNDFDFAEIYLDPIKVTEYHEVMANFSGQDVAGYGYSGLIKEAKGISKDQNLGVLEIIEQEDCLDEYCYAAMFNQIEDFLGFVDAFKNSHNPTGDSQEQLGQLIIFGLDESTAEQLEILFKSNGNKITYQQIIDTYTANKFDVRRGKDITTHKTGVRGRLVTLWIRVCLKGHEEPKFEVDTKKIKKMQGKELVEFAQKEYLKEGMSYDEAFENMARLYLCELSYGKNKKASDALKKLERENPEGLAQIKKKFPKG